MNGRFMLDTDTVSYALRGQGHVAEKVVQHPAWDICISAISMAQLRYGAHRRHSKKLHGLIDRWTRNIQILPFSESCANRYGVVASDLASRGIPIGDWDVLIAAHALTIDATLVTNNVKHFARVPGLRIENWL